MCWLKVTLLLVMLFANTEGKALKRKKRAIIPPRLAGQTNFWSDGSNEFRFFKRVYGKPFENDMKNQLTRYAKKSSYSDVTSNDLKNFRPDFSEYDNAGSYEDFTRNTFEKIKLEERPTSPEDITKFLKKKRDLRDYAKKVAKYRDVKSKNPNYQDRAHQRYKKMWNEESAELKKHVAEEEQIEKQRQADEFDKADQQRKDHETQGGEEADKKEPRKRKRTKRKNNKKSKEEEGENEDTENQDETAAQSSEDTENQDETAAQSSEDTENQGETAAQSSENTENQGETAAQSEEVANELNAEEAAQFEAVEAEAVNRGLGDWFFGHFSNILKNLKKFWNWNWDEAVQGDEDADTDGTTDNLDNDPDANFEPLSPEDAAVGEKELEEYLGAESEDLGSSLDGAAEAAAEGAAEGAADEGVMAVADMTGIGEMATALGASPAAAEGIGLGAMALGLGGFDE